MRNVDENAVARSNAPNANRFRISTGFNHTAVLDQIADEADRDILRLEELLQEIREVPTARLAGFGEDSERSSDERCLLNDESAEFVKVLHRSGFSAEEIAGSMHASLDLIREILHESDDGSSKAA